MKYDREYHNGHYNVRKVKGLATLQVCEIRCAYGRGELQRELASRFGVKQPVISAIVNRNIWTHV